MRTDLNVKGAVFEFVIGNTLKTNFKQSKLFYDIRIKCRWLRRNETQIDLLLLTEKAIYVIEAKNWSRGIIGNYGDYVWRGYGNQPQGMTVVSPFLQNTLHTRMIKSRALLHGCTIPQVFSFICVPDSCVINSDCGDIVHFSQIVQKIASVEHSLTNYFDVRDVARIIGECKV